MKKSARGFTLIELLVAISIIGLLSGIIISALNFARAKGQDGTIKADFNSLHQAAELFYSNFNGSYNTTGSPVTLQGTGCSSATNANTLFADATIEHVLQAVATLNNAGATTGLDCGVTATAYSFVAQLNAQPNTFFCIDSAGYSSSLSRAYNAPYTALTGGCTAANNCAAHAASGATVCQ